MSTGPEMRIGDAERESAVQALGEHYAAGRLTKEEYDERAEQAFAARTSSALWPLFTDLPRPQATAPRTPSPAAPRVGPGGRPGGLGWRAGGSLLPVFLVLLVLVVLDVVPLFVLFIVGGLLWFKVAHRWGHRSSACGSARSR